MSREEQPIEPGVKTGDLPTDPNQAAGQNTEEATRWREHWIPYFRQRANSYWPLPRKLPEHAEKSDRTRWRDAWPAPLRGLADNFYPVPMDPPERFPQTIEWLRERLQTDDAVLADELVADAQRLFDEGLTGISSVESRAATLQGTVAIAATVALAAAGLVVAPGDIHGSGWRLAFVVGLTVLVVFLVLTAFRATSASARVFEFATTSDDDILERAQMSVAAAKSRRAAHLLYSYGRNNEVEALKVGALKAAAFWFRGALLALLAITAIAGIYVVDSGGPVSHRKPSSGSVSQCQTGSTSGSKNKAGEVPNRGTCPTISKAWERPFAVAPAWTLEVAPLRVGCCCWLMLPDRLV